VAERNWRRIDQAPKGIGPLLLREGAGSLDPVIVGYQADDGRWFAGEIEIHPAYFSTIPQFDADEAAS
jgi:hypothetical protein